MDRENLIRRLKYLAHRRSTLELDCMLAAVFQRADWNQFTDEDLIGLELILNLDDRVLEKALLTKTGPPPGAPPDLWDRLLNLLGQPPDQTPGFPS